jgi:starch phosphorylase
VSEYEHLASGNETPTQADESASTIRRLGPTFRPTHPVALAPVTAPAHTLDGFVREFLHELSMGVGVPLARSSVNDQYIALASTVRKYLMARWLETTRRVRESKTKTVAYLSAEYLLGRQLGNALLATDLEGIAKQAMEACGLDYETLRAQEVEPGLGNGGLGRLAACFIDSLATIGIPSIGYGIRYEYGIFRQTFVDGRQVEQPDNWLELGAPWEFPHPEAAVEVGFAGHTEAYRDGNGRERTRWVPGWSVLGEPCNYMVPGYQNGRVNTLRLWRARAKRAFDLEQFNAGDYVEAVRAQTFAENITKVLYPEDSTPQGKELRLQQQYFFVACSIRDFIVNMLEDGCDLHHLPERVVFQMNDTHPVVAIPELLRILVDEHGWEWDDAWATTRRCFAYTCHTLLPEALEVWPAELFARLLPRHYEIIDRINSEFLDGLRATYPGDEAKVRAMSIITDGPIKAIRMAYLATVVGTKVNGVAELHSQLLRDKVFHDFAALWPDKFTNVTNGVTPRRFVQLANPRLGDLITDALGVGWLTDLGRLTELEPYAEDPEFRERFAVIKARNKRHLAARLKARDGIELPLENMLDVMVKRLHEYKRQSLKLLHIVSLYERIKTGKLALTDVTPRTFIFGAKAAPGYRVAKQTIHLMNQVAATINADASLEGRLKVFFPPNYNVTLAERVIPAADLSEQISLAGKEASGTGNMKFALSGALTIGTLDGANVEIREQVGADNFFLFGMTEPEVEALAASGYRPRDCYESDADLKAAVDLIASGAFSGDDPEPARAIVANLLDDDRFMALADFRAYLDAQAEVDAAYADQDNWVRKAVLNVARAGYFSSDRSIRDYLSRVWHATPLV